MRFDPLTFLLTFPKSNLHVLMALAMLPTLRQMACPYAGKNCLSVADINALSGISHRTIESSLKSLHRQGYVVRQHRYGWRLSDGAKQLPLAALFLPQSDRKISAPTVDYLSPPPAQISQIGGKHAGSEKISDPENAGSEKISDPAMIDLIEEEEESIYINTDSVLLLRQIPINGSDYEKLAALPLADNLAGWWHCKTAAWVRNPRSVFVTHMTKHHPKQTPAMFLELSRWWLAADNEQRDDLIAHCRGMAGRPTGLTDNAIKAAEEVYASETSFDYPPRR